MKKLLLLLTILLTTNCSIMEPEYEWGAGLSVPVGFPVRIYAGVVGDKSIMSGFSASLEEKDGDSSWGCGSYEYSSTGKLPKDIDIIWLSYVEDCFYRVKADLDYDKIEKLFKEGYKLRSPRLDINPTGFYKKNFDTILIGLAPGGTVVVWAAGSMRQIEIGRFQAKKIDLKQPKGLDSHDALIFSREEREETLADERFRPKHIAEKPTPLGLWDEYRDTKYPWYPTFEFHPKAKMGDVWVEYFNKERWYIFYDEMVLETPSRKNYSSDEITLIPDIFYQKGEDISEKTYPLPKKFSFAYKANDGLKYGGVYKFDWEETQQAFADFFAQYPNTRARLNFRVSKINNIFTIRLENEKGEGVAIPFHRERLRLVKLKPNDIEVP